MEEIHKNVRMVDLNLLTMKRQIYLLNGGRKRVSDGLER